MLPPKSTQQSRSAALSPSPSPLLSPPSPPSPLPSPPSPSPSPPRSSSEVPSHLTGTAEKSLRLITCGSVDDGKSTLIGRLLWDTKSVSSDHAEGLAESGVVADDGLKLPEFALLLDGLQAEREQGITIDVAYHYFSTPQRSFIVADTPGHEQYTRNMATGCSTADLAIVLVDARTGVLEQTRRHATIAALMGIGQLVLVVNKMDLVNYSQSVFEAISLDFQKLAKLLLVHHVTAIPVSALRGQNVVAGDEGEMPWYSGATVLQTIEQAKVAARLHDGFRFSVQRVSRPDESFRGYQGTLAGGTVTEGQEIMVLPGGARAQVQQIVSFDDSLAQAQTGDAVTLVLDRHIDIARGDMLVTPGEQPMRARRFGAHLVVLSQSGLVPGRRYWLKSSAKSCRVDVSVNKRLKLDDGNWISSDVLAVNAIGAGDLTFEEDVFFDLYADNHQTGSFILIDPQSNNTVAAGMITGRGSDQALENARDDRFMVLTVPRKLGETLLRSDLLAPHRDEIRIASLSKTQD